MQGKGDNRRPSEVSLEKFDSNWDNIFGQRKKTEYFKARYYTCKSCKKSVTITPKDEYICDSCNKRHEIFSYGGAKEAAKEFDTNFLGEIPIDKSLRIQSDNGNPLCISAPNIEVSEIYLSIVKKIDASLNN